MAHGHEVLHMMEGNSYANSEELIQAIISRFGADEVFHTCSAEGMTAAELVSFLEKKGKFLPTDQENSFTVDSTKICNH